MKYKSLRTNTKNIKKPKYSIIDSKWFRRICWSERHRSGSSIIKHSPNLFGSQDPAGNETGKPKNIICKLLQILYFAILWMFIVKYTQRFILYTSLYIYLASILIYRIQVAFKRLSQNSAPSGGFFAKIRAPWEFFLMAIAVPNSKGDIIDVQKVFLEDVYSNTFRFHLHVLGVMTIIIRRHLW